MGSLKLASFNVNGLNVPTKRKTIFGQLREVGADVSLLQESHSTESIAHLWGTEWGGQAFFNHGLSNSRGVAILFSRNFMPQVIKTFSDGQGRVLLMDVEFNNEVFTIGSVYAPTQDKPEDQLSFLKILQEGLETMSGTSVFLAGDFNRILNPSLDRNSSVPLPANRSAYRDALKSFMEEGMLSDVWRDRHSNETNFTFRRASYASRLDLILVSSHLSEGVSEMKSQVSSQSDHRILTAVINKSDFPKGPGLWKFDISLLKNDDFIGSMSDFLTNWISPPELDNPCVIWDWLKFQIKEYVVKYARGVHSREKQTIKALQKELEELTDRLDKGRQVSDEANSVRRELKQIEEARANKLIFRSRCRWAQLGEKPSHYFLNLEKRQAKDRTLSSISLPDEGGETNNPKKILQACSDFYSDLYSEKDHNLSQVQVVQEAISHLAHPRLSDQAREQIDALPTADELKKALYELNSNKSPGSDGLPPEFYRQFGMCYHLICYEAINTLLERDCCRWNRDVESLL